MYTFKRSYVKYNSDNEWRRESINALRMDNILALDDVKIILALDINTEIEFAVMQSDLRRHVRPFDYRFSLTGWLSTFTEDTITRSDRPLSLPESGSVEQFELFKIGAWVQPSGGNGQDLEILTNRTDGQTYSREYFNTNCLLGVNGRVFRIQKQIEGSYALNSSAQLSDAELKQHSLSLIDFSALNGIETLSVREDQVTETSLEEWEEKNNLLKFKIKLDAPVTGKTPFAVIDGWLYIMNGTVKQVSSDTLLITLDKQQLYKRILKDKNNRERLPYIYNSNISGGGIRIDTLVAAKLMADVLSFVGFINDKELMTRTEMVAPTTMPFMYYHYRIPKGLVFFEDGELVQYSLMMYNEHRACLSVPNNAEKLWSMDTVPFAESLSRPKTGNYSGGRRKKHLYVLDIYKF